MKGSDFIALVLGAMFALIVLPNFRKAREPVLYLYPPKVMAVEVKLHPGGRLTDSYPRYGDAWNVTASPDGTLMTGSATYRNLFYEADIGFEALPAAGWTVRGQDLGAWFDRTLANLGYIGPEIADFQAYWLKVLAATQTWEIHLMPREFIDRKLAVSIVPAPDTFLRTLFHFRAVKDARPLTAPDIQKVERKGFTAVEWGGVLEP